MSKGRWDSGDERVEHEHERRKEMKGGMNFIGR